jgi:hypothetical protein
VEAGLHSETGMSMTMRLETIDFVSVGVGKWSIESTFAIGDQAPFVVWHEMTYPVSFGAVAACEDVTRATVPAVREFLHELYNSPQFREASVAPVKQN